MIACELELVGPEVRPYVVAHLRAQSTSPLLVLDTCQRLETVGDCVPRHGQIRVLRSWLNESAFERLTRIAAGLESRILGELEILGQVRTAYRCFRKCAAGNHRRFDRILQESLALARKARRESGIDRNHTSLGALAAREMTSRVERGALLAVIGSGSLASSVARHLHQCGGAPLRVASRRAERAEELASAVDGDYGGLDRLSDLLTGVVGIVTATSAPCPVLYPCHLIRAARPLTIVDLATPSDCSEDISHMSAVEHVGLPVVEQKVRNNSAVRRECAETAAQIVSEGTSRWLTRNSQHDMQKRMYLEKRSFSGRAQRAKGARTPLSCR